MPWKKCSVMDERIHSHLNDRSLTTRPVRFDPQEG
jgi:hypothetical protein